MVVGGNENINYWRIKMDIYVVMVNDRHAEPEAYLFTNKKEAMEFAKATAESYCHDVEDLKEIKISGWEYYIEYSCEADCIWVIKKELDGELNEA